MNMFKEIADIKTSDQLKLPVPEAEYETVVLKPTEQQKEIVESLGERAEVVRNGGVDAAVDNMLKITNDGRKLALDQRLVNELLPDNPESKISVCAEKSYEIWKDTAAQKSAQLIFCDLSTPKGDGSFNVYDDLKRKLMEKGVPEKEIAFLHDANTEAKKTELFGKVKSGRDVERLRPLYEQNAASQLDLDNAIAAYESAKANVAMSKADLAQAEMELGYTTVRSPISGYISERHADIGTLVGPGSKSLLATVVASDTVLVDFSLTALDYLRSQQRNVRLGEQDATRSWQPSITVTLADNSVYPEKGLVDFAEPQVDPKTGTFGVRAELANPGRNLLPGQFTKVKLLLDVRENAVVVPARAIIIEKGGAHVYVMRRDSTAEKRFIETGAEVGNFVVVER